MRLARLAIAIAAIVAVTACGVVGGADYSHYTTTRSTCYSANVRVIWDSGYIEDKVWNGEAKPKYEKRNNQGEWVPDKAGAHFTLNVDSKSGEVSWSTAHGTRVVCTERVAFPRKFKGLAPQGADHKTDPYSRLGERYQGEGIPFTKLPPNPKDHFLALVVIKGYTTDPKVPKFHPNEHPDITN